MLGKRKLVEAQKEKKKKKWIEELDDDSEEIDLDCLNNLEEEEIADLEKEDEDVLEEEGKNGASNMTAGDDETIIDNGNNKKKKRYDWMSSDDEDISSEEDEEEEVVELVEKGKEKKEQEQDEERINSSDETHMKPDNASEQGTRSRNSSELKGGEENGNVRYHPNGTIYDMNNSYWKNENIGKINIDERSNHSDDGPMEIIENINKYSINPLDIKLKEIEHLVTYVYFNNIHFSCVTEHLVQFLEKFTKNKIVQINSDKSTNHTIIYKYDGKNNETVLINKFPHYGKLFVHVKNYQDVLRLLKLNETQFMGRIIKSTQAYKKKNSFYILQAPSHYKYFIQVLASEKNKNSTNYV
ncbi:conserved Plasmodium protein, unknown function [Plasmodium knowlesi strain H]|uniref:RRM domain-containing protein n=3 Tax=Plasmodium knowlesi TaxID=5850 RepID=A0A5K1UL16_PLAKH|nr:conserved Plasmodium protein, unknown function [Plasmodium knowlesi strain H]OTN64033.1 Uncharacterized protein PKNOH_S140224000 [Plasmodium knowlesi]CAA9990668.1 conserved Plasmodium protein, unknown function [Plasmodium knowlesi strain H]SBO25955.1 conserved Plasmodium protein, unknown function [Plasmodium knowlesi strain H]SBO28690.1 conserved Plasmodium protein, unknown function [Plasmodium knowlesi strain H]VVS80142.1 conserved Plasmodium protein, unknown function [Plasmodium knowlesi |eukprot:XP_002261959.1 hypothetical protein, conserved in Plasmodium species [Plasmodium knowlesi strain H]